MSHNNEVVDLTADTDQGHDSLNQQPKRRVLPASVLPSAPSHQATRPLNALDPYSSTGLAYPATQTSINNGSRPPSNAPIVVPPVGARPLTMAVGSYLPAGMAYSAPPRPINNMSRLPSYIVPTVGGRTLPASVLQPSGGTQYLAQYPKPSQYALPNAKIVFSIINSKHFTARAESGTVNQNLISTFKMVPGAKFDWQSCKWLFPLSAHDVLHVALTTHHKHPVEPLPRYTIAAAQLKNQRDEQNAPGQGDAAESLLALKGHIPDKVLHQLAPFQRQAVQFVMGNKGRAMIADEMGLGKTRTAISAAMAYRDDWPVLIVSPSSARHHWQAELLSVLHPEFIDPKDISVVESSAHPIHKGAQHFKSKILIVSYHLISKITDILLSIPFNVVIVDESHYMKNANAQRTRMLMPILHKAKRAFLLSGTPALSRPFELFTQLHAIAPAQWPSEKDYGRRYCTVSKAEKKARQLASGSSGPKSWSEFSGASNIEELHMMLTATIMIRRLKKDILAQLPEKQRRIVKVPIEDTARKTEMMGMLSLAEEYEEKLAAQKRSRSQGAERAREMEELAEMRARKKNILMSLFTMSGEAKLPAILKHMDTFLDDPLSGKLLVFCHHRSVMEGLAKYLAQRGQEYIRIDGGTPSKERHSRVQTFQGGSHCRVAILAITAAGIALTLTAASTVFFAELFWTPASLLQAEDRAHRIGQTSTVKVTYFLANSTVDELLWPLVRQKMKLLGEIVEGSKDLDFAAATEDNESEVFPTSSSSKDGCGASVSMVGSKRGIDNSPLIKDEELGDIANEIAADLRASAKKGSGSGSGKRGGGRDGSETSDEEEDADGEGEDDLAVVAIEEPDQLAQLYMKMYNGRAARSVAPALAGLQRVASAGSLAGTSSSGSNLQSSVGNGGESSSAGGGAVSLLTPAKSDSKSDTISLISPADEEKWAKSMSRAASQSSSTQGGRAIQYQPGEVVDLFEDDDVCVASTAASSSSSSSSSNGRAMDTQQQAPSSPGWDQGEESFANPVDVFGAMTDPHFSSPGLSLMGDDDGDFPAAEESVVDLLQQTPPLQAAPVAQTSSTIEVHQLDYSPRAADFDSPYMSKQELIVQAKQAWSSAIAAQVPKSNRPAGKFTPSLKRADSSGSLKRADSSASLGRIEETIQSIAVTSSANLQALDAPPTSTEVEECGTTNVGSAVVASTRDIEGKEDNLQTDKA